VKTARHKTWSALGSTLWLRAVARQDQAKVTAFGARSDLVRSEPVGETIRSGKNGRQRTQLLVAVDPRGAPAVLLTVHYGPAPGEATLSFAVPPDGAHALRETLRLLGDLIRRRTRLTRVHVRVRPHGIGLRRVLAECGWREEAPGAWFLQARASSREKVHAH
jgi:hypothetical protein